jgi:Na+-driven multidrug efflux pump
VIIRKRSLPFTFNKENIRFESKIVARIFKIGFPIALQESLVSISFLVIAAIVNTLGVIASAGVGVAEKICGFIMLVPSAFSQSLSAFVAQNIGAGKPDRARKAMACGMSASFTIGVPIAYFSFFHGEVLSRIFSNDGQVILAAADYLRAYAVDVMMVAFLFCFLGYFNGCGNTKFVMMQGIIGAFGIRIPVSYFMSKIENVSLFGIGLATPASTIVQIILCVIFLRYTVKREKALTR